MNQTEPSKAVNMKTVPDPTVFHGIPTPDGTSHPIRPVSSLVAELVSEDSVVLLRLRDPGNQYVFRFALSPPAAAQLSRMLENAVRQHLYGDDHR